MRDSQTGIVWAGHDNGGDINWKDAKRYCAKSGKGWELPTVAELQGLFDPTGTLTQRCGSFSCNVTPLIRLSSLWFWSGESNGSSEAWDVILDDGHRHSGSVGDANVTRALCVRRS